MKYTYKSVSKRCLECGAKIGEKHTSQCSFKYATKK